MAVRGSESKEKITKALLQIFNGAFVNDKEIRIPVREGGETIQIKVTLTAAKENINTSDLTASEGVVSADNGNRELTEDEIKEVRKILEDLNL